MDTREAHIIDYQNNMQVIQALVGLMLLFIILWPFLFSISEDRSEEMGTGGAIACFVLWMVLTVIYSVLFIWMMIKKSETAATMSLFLSWLFFLAIFDITSSIQAVFAAIPPALLTVYVLRMIWLVYRIEKTSPPTSAVPPYGIEHPKERR